MTPVKVAVVSHDSRDDVRAFSGIPHHMTKALGARAELTGYVRVPPFDLRSALAGGTAGRRLLEDAGAVASRALECIEAEFVLCSGGAMVPELRSRVPVVQWHDSTWHALLRLPFDDFAHRYPFLREWDQRVLDRCALVAYAADWVRDDTLAHYDGDPTRVVVVPFGANLSDGEEISLEQILDLRRRPPLRLAFIGVDWERKGLMQAHRLLIRLRRLGLDAELTVLGAAPEDDGPTGTWLGDCGGLERATLRADPHVRLLGFVDKSVEGGRETVRAVLSETHYLVHPAAFECFGIVLAEAAAYGVPVLALDAYGPRTVVRNGRTGHLFPPEGFVDGASAVILAHLENPLCYEAEVRAARSEYLRRLNWTASVDRLLRSVARLPAAATRSADQRSRQGSERHEA